MRRLITHTYLRAVVTTPSVGIHTNEDLYIVMAKLGWYLREQGYDINRLRGVSVDAPHGTIIIDTRYC